MRNRHRSRSGLPVSTRSGGQHVAPDPGSWVDLLDIAATDRVLLIDPEPRPSAGRLAARCAGLVVVDHDPDAAGDPVGPGSAQSSDLVCVHGFRLTDALLARAGSAVAAGGALVLVVDNALSPLRVLDAIVGRPVGPAPQLGLGRVLRRVRRCGLRPEQVFALLRSSAAPVTAFDLASPTAIAAVVQASLSHVGGSRGAVLRTLRTLRHVDRRAGGRLAPAWLVVAGRPPREPDRLRIIGKVSNRESFETKILRGEPPSVLEKHYRLSDAAAEVEALTELERVGFELAPRLHRRPSEDVTWTSWLPGRPLDVRRMSEAELLVWTRRAAQVLARLHDLTRRTDGTVLVHGDLWLGNLLVDHDRVSGLVDWTVARRGPPQLDRDFLVHSVRQHRRVSAALRERLLVARDEGLGRPVPAVACVLGGMDIVSPLGAAGVDCAVFVPRDDPARHSRHVRQALDPGDPWEHPEAYVDRLVRWGKDQPTPPVLFYPTDGDLVMVSRHREELATAFRFALPEAGLVDDLTDKARFARLAERLGLPVPAARPFRVTDGPGALTRLRFPVVVKPVLHRGAERLVRDAKALPVSTPAALRALWPRLRETGLDCFVQELVPGPETSVVSYHAYVDSDGRTVGEFAGEKLRTHPLAYGFTTALTITDDAEVLSSGRTVTARLGLRGVLKADFKRDPAGRLWLLEVNARFNLWHHAGAVAGVNLPALYFADLTGSPRPPVHLRPGITWCDLPTDRRAMLAAGSSTASWLWFATRCDARSAARWRDPMPFLQGILLPGLARRLGAHSATADRPAR